MKFSLLALLAAIAYVATSLAGLKEPDSWWRYAATAAWFAIVAYFVASATGADNSPATRFGRTTVGGIVIYLFLAYYSASLPVSTRNWDILPHQWLSHFLLRIESSNGTTTVGGLIDPSKMVRARTNLGTSVLVIAERVDLVQKTSAMNCALVFGLIAGYVALWQKRRHEQKSKAL